MKRTHGFSAFHKESSKGGVQPPFPSYLRRMMTKLCIKIHMKFDSAIESAFP